MASPRIKPSFTSLVAFLLVVTPLLYVLSYAPVVRVCGRGDTRYPGWVVLPREEYPLYKPLDWLIDETPIRTPLFYWADICGVRAEFEKAAFYRENGILFEYVGGA